MTNENLQEKQQDPKIQEILQKAEEKLAKDIEDYKVRIIVELLNKKLNIEKQYKQKISEIDKEISKTQELTEISIDHISISNSLGATSTL